MQPNYLALVWARQGEMKLRVADAPPAPRRGLGSETVRKKQVESNGPFVIRDDANLADSGLRRAPHAFTNGENGY